MGRREILNGLFGLVGAAGIAAVIGATASEVSFKEALLWSGIGAVAVSAIGYAYLFGSARKAVEPPSEGAGSSSVNISSTNQSGGVTAQTINGKNDA